ncbi:MAG: DUF1611 domain-containing protein [Thermoplasmatota archaeon]
MTKRAVVFVDNYFKTADGKIAHGLVRYSKRFEITSIVDSTIPEGDAGEILDGTSKHIPLYNSLDYAIQHTQPDTFIIGAVSDGGILPKGYDKAVIWALEQGLHVVSGLHEFISDNPLYTRIAEKNNCTIIDVRKIFRDYKRFYTGEIQNVSSIRIALLGTDSAIGKRTIAVLLNQELQKRNHTSDMIYTGQTGWMQGWPHGIVLDAMINDFVSGGIEGAILDCWKDHHPTFMLIEGQGSLLHPFFPGGFEILAAGSVHGYILVDAPGRPHLDGFKGYPLPDPKKIVTIADLITNQKLLGIGINQEQLTPQNIHYHKKRLNTIFNVPVVEPLSEGVGLLVDALEDVYDI